MFRILRGVRLVTYLWWNLLTIIVTIQVLERHLIRLCMGESVDPQFVGMMLENEKILGPEIIQRTCEKVN